MMKCMVVHDEGIIWVLLVLITAINCLFIGENSQTIQELCSSNRYIYNLESEENYQLILTSSNSSGQINKWYQKSKRKCLKEFKTDGASHILVVLSNISIPSCSEKCHCNYLEIADRGHKEKFCGEIKEHLYFESKDDYLSIDFHHTLSLKFEITLAFSVKRNLYTITGLPKESYRSGHFLETPYFPQLYQFDYIADYILHSDDLSGHVMLMFLDYQIAPESVIEVSGHNGTHPGIYNGNVFRPPVFISQKHQLNLKFAANSQVKFGFRAACFFIKDSDVQNSKPFTNCGGLEGGYGGSLNIDVHADHDYYDCLWHVFPPVPSIFQSHFLTISNITLHNIGPNASLEFREGLNSKSKLVKSIDCNSSNPDLIPAEITVPAASGLYIRFNGKLKPDSVLKMIYGTYRIGNCSENEILCNERCLLSGLRCDGIEHCPDGKDEQECTSDSTILQTTASTVVKLKLHSENTVASFIVVLTIGVCGLVLFAFFVILFLYRHFKSAGSTTNRTEQHQDRENRVSFPNVCPRISSCFDEPPSYEDFIQSSDCYPPLFYTRSAKRSSEPYCNLYTSKCCGKNSPRHHSIHFFNSHNLSSTISDSNSTSTRDSESRFPEPGCSFSRNSVEWTIDNSQQRNSTPYSLKRAASFDSKMNKKFDSDNCHLLLSITHSMCPEACLSKHHSLPTHFKINELKSNEIDITVRTIVPGMQCNNERRFSSCTICNNSLTVKSEIMTTIKARCFSDPCKTNM